MASYNDKLIDSLATRIQLFLFWKSFYKEVIKTEDIANYMDEIEQFKITNDLANLYSNTYYQTDLKKDLQKAVPTVACSKHKDAGKMEFLCYFLVP